MVNVDLSVILALPVAGSPERSDYMGICFLFDRWWSI